MKNIQKIKSVHANYFRNWMIFATIVFGFLTVLMRGEIFNDSHLDLIGLILFLFALGLSLVCLNYLINETEIEISKGEIISKNKLRKKVFKNITGFKKEKYDGEYASGERLIFKHEKGFLVIDSNSYRNYFEMVKFTQKNFKRLGDNYFKQYDFKQTLFVRVFFLFSTFLFFGIFLSSQFEDVDKILNELQRTEITLSEAPEFEASEDYIQIFSEKYPAFEFKISGDRYEACDRSILKELKRGDIIEIGLEDNALQSKILKSKAPSFTTKYFHWESIWIYQLKHKNKNYIDIDELKNLMILDKSWSWVFLLFGFFSIYFVFRKY